MRTYEDGASALPPLEETVKHLLTAQSKLRKASRMFHLALAVTVLCPIFTLVLLVARDPDSSLYTIIGIGSSMLAVLAVVSLVKLTRRRSGWPVFLGAFITSVLSVPSVLMVSIFLTIRLSWFGGSVGSIAEGGVQSGAAMFIVLLVAVPLTLVVAPVLVALLVLAVRCETKLRIPPAD
jgi:hypothetical protein